MQVVEVNNTITEKAFLEIAATLNKSNPKYIRPLDNDIKKIFNPELNKSFKYGTAKRWLLLDGNKTIGRIAAFTSSKYINKGTDFVTGGVGFFECVNNTKASNLLFDTAKNWLQQQGCEAMDGPINFGDRDQWWGLLVEGFDMEPIVGMPFNPDYYEALFEAYGFKNYYNQYWFKMIVSDPLPQRFTERYEKFANKPGYEAKHISLKELDKYANDFATVYNAAWAQHGEAKEITKEQVLKLFKTLKPIMDERVVWFAYYKEEPIAMFINIPDVNQYIKGFNGRLGLWQKLQLLYKRKTMKYQKLVGLAFGVVPKYQALGIDSYLIKACGLLIQDKDWYKSYEMGWAGDWNPKMHNIYKSLGGSQSRRMVTYRYIFDETKHPFERHPVMDYTK